ncbi:MAG TPA: hypothetical protein VFN22_09830 [Gemmatimonadales bacterium]|nr:hypothetical protein [Gemmatimonadales bacterium]
MTERHLGMGELLAVRDNDRSEPAFVLAHRHVAACPACRREVDRLHQVTARLRALPTLEPQSDHFSAIRARLQWERRQQWTRRIGGLGVAAAAILAVVLIGNDLAHPPSLDAEQQIDSLMSRSERLEQTLRAWRPEARVLDGHTVEVVLELEDRIADVDHRLQGMTRLEAPERRANEAALWQERVGLMNALVNVHLTKATNLDL